ncbi:hypothetical protein OUZ56_032907 [Daphnia magna]|uniref:Uncharacterized protein n=1 Tax=Daphnia magna TaxID=35525 RepID=A0ABQ9ZX56_9CRUS|nr:hypothetical protein OUZ56_032907 [Daphnia magna]
MARENAIIDDFLEDLAYFSDEENTKSIDEEEKRASKKNRMSKLLPFYQTRNDIFGYFYEDRIMKTFRFDRDSIQFILADFLGPIL